VWKIDLKGRLTGTAMARERVMRRNAFSLVDMRLFGISQYEESIFLSSATLERICGEEGRGRDMSRHPIFDQ
jgi:hypothetical protein